MSRAFNGSGAAQAAILDIFKVFARVCHAALLHKVKTYKISGQIFGLISSFVSIRQLQMVLDAKPLQEYSVNDLPDDVLFS